MFKFLKRLISAAIGQNSAYSSTDHARRLLEGWRIARGSSNETLAPNLQTLIAQCRHLERTTTTARSVVEGHKADIIGTGIDVEPDTGDQTLDKLIKPEWLLWAECASVDGRSLWELQHQAVGELDCAGAILWRKVVIPDRIEKGLIPFAIMAYEPEWLCPFAVAAIAPGTRFVEGIEVDKFNRPIAYHLADPCQDYGTGRSGERVLASEIIHGFEARRPLQAHGEPILAPAVERIKQEEDLVSIELKAAKNTSALAVAITSKYHPDETSDGSTGSDAEAVTDMSPGSVVRLFPDEDVKTISNNRPNQLIDAFRKMLQGDVAGACRTAVKWLRKDYSGATFMNARLEQLDNKRMHAPTQQWLGRFIASAPYESVLPWIMLRLGRSLPSDPRANRAMLRHKLMPDSPGYVDPVKDEEGAVNRIRDNLSTLQEEAAALGKDWRKIIEQRKLENDELKKAGLNFAADAQIVADAAIAKDQAKAQANKPADKPAEPAPARESQVFHIEAPPAPEPAAVNVSLNVDPAKPVKRTYKINRDSKGNLESFDSEVVE